MRERFERLSGRSAARSMLGAALGIFVLEGTATVARAGSAVVLRAGEPAPGAPLPKGATLLADAKSTGAKVGREAAGRGRGGGGDVLAKVDAFDADRVNAVLARAEPALQKCFEVSGRADERAVGVVAAELEVRPDGTVAEGTVAQEYSIQNPLVASCLVEALSRLRYPAPKGGAASRLTLPFVAAMRGEGASRRVEVSLPSLVSSTTAAPAAEMTGDVRVGGSPSRGPADAPITLVQILDYECAFCVRSEVTVTELLQAYPGMIRHVVMQNPMPFHPRARLAATAALAAHEQGKFWELHAVLRSHPNAIDRESLVRYAGEIGLDVARFDAALGDGHLEPAISADRAEAERLGAKGVPSFFVNGRLVMGAQPLERFEAIVDEELRKVGR